MPRAPKSPSTPPKKAKPYAREDTSSPRSADDISDVEFKPHTSDSEDAEVKPSPGKRSRKGVKGVPWTGDELVTMFNAVSKSGNTKIFDGLIEGREGLKCLSTWRNTVEPFIRKALLERGNAKTGKGAPGPA